MSMFLIFLIIFYAFFSILAIYQDYHSKKLYIITKPIPMGINIGLAVYVLVVGTVPLSLSIPILAGLVAGITGDILLSLDKKYFLPGLIAFLVGHILYVVGFIFQGAVPQTTVTSITWGLAAFTGTFLATRMSNKSMRLPVLGYVAVISTMVMFAFSYESASPETCRFFSAGAALFALSDSTLAYEKFIKPFGAAGFMVLATYYAAQFLFVLGLMKMAYLF